MSEYIEERKELLNKIRYVKGLLDSGMNEKNYENKSTPELYIILRKYEKEFNSKNLNLYYIEVSLYKQETNSMLIGKIGYDKIQNKEYNLKLFDSELKAKDFIKNQFNLPDGYELNNYEIKKLILGGNKK